MTGFSISGLFPGRGERCLFRMIPSLINNEQKWLSQRLEGHLSAQSCERSDGRRDTSLRNIPHRSDGRQEHHSAHPTLT